jgi:ABC-type transport system substrate-binding protein
MPSRSLSGLMRNRLTRRRVLAGAGAGSAAALLLAACGGDGDDGDGGGQERGLLAPVRNRTSEAVRGGTLTTTVAQTYVLDALTGPTGGTRVQTQALFNRFFKAKPGILEPSDGEIIGDAAESYELSPDGLRLTIKLKQNLGTDPRPPVNGRKLDASDALFSWNVWAEQNTLRSTLVNSIDPNAPVESIATPDNQTVVFKLAFPNTLILGYLTDGFYFWILPKEAADKYDARNEAHGAGPWYLESWQQDTRLEMRRNPNYYDSKLPYLEGIDVIVLPEAAAILAQFEAKRIDVSGTVFAGGGITNDNVLEVHKRLPETQVFAVPSDSSSFHFRPGYADGSPFRDVRMRRALSMSLNRADMAEFFTNASKLSEGGLPTEPTWAGHVPPVYPIGVDIRDRLFSASAANFEYNPAEAKKLVSAAGQEGKPLELMYASAAMHQTVGGVEADQLRQAGWQVSERVLDTVTEFVPTVVRRRGDYQGVASHLMLVQFAPEGHVYTNFHPTPATSCVRDRQDFPELTALSDSMLTEFDTSKREGLLKDWMVRAATELPSIPLGAVAPSYHLAWPWIANIGVYQRWVAGQATNVDTFLHYWYDRSKDTRAS